MKSKIHMKILLPLLVLLAIMIISLVVIKTVENKNIEEYYYITFEVASKEGNATEQEMNHFRSVLASYNVEIQSEYMEKAEY